MTMECAIPQKFHRSVMGPKGSRIQQITRDYNVQIKFPDREENPGGSAVSSVPLGKWEARRSRPAVRWAQVAVASWRSASLPGGLSSGSPLVSR